jgi:hypothetical protein
VENPTDDWEAQVIVAHRLGSHMDLVIIASGVAGISGSTKLRSSSPEGRGGLDSSKSSSSTYSFPLPSPISSIMSNAMSSPTKRVTEGSNPSAAWDLDPRHFVDADTFDRWTTNRGHGKLG